VNAVPRRELHHTRGHEDAKPSILLTRFSSFCNPCSGQRSEHQRMIGLNGVAPAGFRSITFAPAANVGWFGVAMMLSESRSKLDDGELASANPRRLHPAL
jgi:hypothetical protein